MNFLLENWSLLLIALVSGGMLVWPMVRGAGAGHVTPQGAVQRINRDRAVLVDVSEAEEFARGHAAGARNVPFSELEQRLPAVVKNKALPVILMCPTGARAARALPLVKKLGYEQASVLAGGLKAWKAAELPLDKPR